tara:strand:- start:1343 stop:1552 length:210 start_codon:yes stop_codon:yes gene_type:complete
MKSYKVSGWVLNKNFNTYELEQGESVENFIVKSVLDNIDGYEDRCFLEVEISKQYGCTYFELDTLELIN